MAEHPELWTDRTPERQLFDRAPAAFGLAGVVDHLGEVAADEPEAPARPRKPRRQRGPFVTHLCLPWSYTERPNVDRWHRLLCRLGRHDMQGGHTMQLADGPVFIERTCRWCQAGP